MIDAVATICIFVSDQDRAKAFYTGTYMMILDADDNALLMVEEPR